MPVCVGRNVRLTRAASEGVDEESTNETADETDDRSKGDRSGGLSEGDTTDEDDGFHTYAHASSEITVGARGGIKRTFSENGNQGQNKQDPLAALCFRIDV